jgi:hypothetical protein
MLMFNPSSAVSKTGFFAGECFAQFFTQFSALHFHDFRLARYLQTKVSEELGDFFFRFGHHPQAQRQALFAPCNGQQAHPCF